MVASYIHVYPFPGKFITYITSIYLKINNNVFREKNVFLHQIINLMDNKERIVKF
jgi:hypothetical protein